MGSQHRCDPIGFTALLARTDYVEEQVEVRWDRTEYAAIRCGDQGIHGRLGLVICKFFPSCLVGDRHDLHVPPSARVPVENVTVGWKGHISHRIGRCSESASDP